MTHYELVETLNPGKPNMTDVIRSIHGSRYEAEDAMMDRMEALPTSAASLFGRQACPFRVFEIVTSKDGSRVGRVI